MNKLTAYLKENKRYMVLIKGAIALLFPLLLCVIYCAIQGKTIGQAYLPDCEWNDELFYYKQVEGIVKFGFPQGYFGFNESHAESLSFAAWSPVLVFPWIIWGLVFGWNLLSPIICNIVLLCITTCLFVVLTGMNWKQMASLGIGMICFIPFERYMLSGMPEIICFCMVILFSAFSYSFLVKDKTWKFVMMLVMSAIMTLMRPYLLLFMLLPLVLAFTSKKIGRIVASIITFIVTLLIYACVKKYLGAEYFTPLFSMNWLTDFFTKGIGTGIHNFFGRLYYMTRDFIGHSIQGVRTGLASGAFFVTYIIMIIVFAVQFVLDLVKFVKSVKKPKNEAKKTESNEEVKKDKKEVVEGIGLDESVRKRIKELSHTALKSRLILEGHYLFAMLGMLAALLLMYKLTEGSKHLLTFIAGGIFVMALMNNEYFIKNVVIGLTCVFFFVAKANSAYDYQVPFATADTVAKTESWKEAMKEMTLTEDAPNFDNVVIWNLYDKLDDKIIFMKWQRLYSLPEGFGISCCECEYVVDNMDSLQSKYIVTLTDGTVDKMLEEKGKTLIYKDDEVSMYILR